MKLYHGTDRKIEHPNLVFGRKNTDFGQGFYLTNDEFMAKKWAARKGHPIINIYEFDLDNLKIKKLGLNKEWLDCVIANRNGEKDLYRDFDVIIGATADDKMFTTIENYENGYLNAFDTIRILNNMNIGMQYCLKTEQAIKQLNFVKASALDYHQVLDLKDKVIKERRQANILTAQMTREAKQKQIDISSLTPEQLSIVRKMLDENKHTNDDLELER